MQWRLIATLSLLGLAVGVLSLFGLWPVWAEFLVWTGVGLSWVLLLHPRVQSRPFWHGAATAFLGGMLAILTQVVFLHTYLENNPAVASDLTGYGDNQRRAILLGSGLGIVTMYSLVTGLALWLASRKGTRERSESDYES